MTINQKFAKVVILAEKDDLRYLDTKQVKDKMDNGYTKIQVDLKKALARIAILEQEAIALKHEVVTNECNMKALNLFGVRTGMDPNLKTEIKIEILTSLRVDIRPLCSLIKNIGEELLTLKEDIMNNDNATLAFLIGLNFIRMSWLRQ